MVTEQTGKLQSRSLQGFLAWAREQDCVINLDRVSAAPALLDALVHGYGAFLFSIGAPLYIFRYCLTGLHHYELSLKRNLPRAW